MNKWINKGNLKEESVVAAILSSHMGGGESFTSLTEARKTKHFWPHGPNAPIINLENKHWYIKFPINYRLRET